jgi:hypothetical protein
MNALVQDVKLKEVFPDVAEREITIKPVIRTLDKHGRLYVDVDLAKKSFIFVMIDPAKGDIERFSREAGGGKPV